MTEKQYLDFSADFFNIFNHTNFELPRYLWCDHDPDRNQPSHPVGAEILLLSAVVAQPVEAVLSLSCLYITKTNNEGLSRTPTRLLAPFRAAFFNINMPI